MKRIFYLAGLLALLSGCGTTKNYLERSDNDKALFDAVKKLNKKAADEDAVKALPLLYERAQQRHLGDISNYNQSQDLNRWGKILEGYTVMQNIYNAIVASTPANQLVRPADYSREIQATRQNAAEEYYQYALGFEDSPGRENAIKAYNAYNRASEFMPGYKDTKARMDNVYEATVLDVVINPIQENGYYYNAGYNYNKEYFQQNLVRDLGGAYNRNAQARFYTDRDVAMQNLRPDWAVDLTLRRLDIPRPYTTRQTRNISRSIEKGTDSSGHKIYETVYATLTIYQQSFTARADMEVSITETGTQKNITYNNYNEDYQWQEAYATYTGDRRALSSTDWDLVNNTSFRNIPGREDVINELYRRLYPQVKSRIRSAVEW